ncbi:hypothetical protein HWV62_21628 [Athelia sp. TMB]|nr:hypothetical protein HWV62_33323 [Athelia sp. TMB]KAF7971221.1 hypothetical protein HWV62_21628 [Athelia sp. TMB]
MPSAKRKHASSESSSDNDESSSAFRTLADANPSKRQRCSVLENGFAHLAIHHKPDQSTTSTYAQAPSVPTVIELDSTLGARPFSPMPVDGEPSAVTTPSSVEEPVTPDYSGSILPAGEEPMDVKMRSQSWYEPEKDRIVITDLDDSDDETDSNSVSEANEIIISNALLEHIKKQPTFTSVLPAEDNASGALVLFRPLLSASDLATAEPAEPETTVSSPPQNDEDAMDVEP